MTGCSFSGNTASDSAGGVLVTSNGQVRDCVLWGNAGDVSSGVQDQIISTVLGSSAVTSCDIQDLGGAFPNAGNIEADPLFADADGPDDVPGTEDDDLSLLAGSPCIDAGDVRDLDRDFVDVDEDGDTDETNPWDRDGARRIRDDPATADTGYGCMDMGALEFQAGPSLPVTQWQDLGQALAGTHGEPLLEGSGTLLPSAPTELILSGALEDSTVYFILGLSALNAPFKQGVLVPFPDVVVSLPSGGGCLLILFDWFPDPLPPGSPSTSSSGSRTAWDRWDSPPATPWWVSRRSRTPP